MCPFECNNQNRLTWSLVRSMHASVWRQQAREWHPPIFTLNRNTMISANNDSGNDYDTLDTLGHLRWMMQK
jgi:hypothetical protein